VKGRRTPNLAPWLAGALLLGRAAGADPPDFQAGVSGGNTQSALINEASGLAASRRNPHVLWTHNDSGDSARVFAINPAGDLLGVFTLTGASATDWEDMALGADPVTHVHYLYAGDIGDNSAARSSITVYRVPEPFVDAGQASVVSNLPGVQALRFTYPDGARDAETLLADSLTGDLFIVTKREALSRIYRAPYPQNPSASTPLEYLGQLSFGGAVGGDLSPSGRQVLIKQYSAMHYYSRPPGTTVLYALTNGPSTVPCASEPQGEAVGWQGRERGYYTLSEGTYQPVYYYAALDGDEDGLVDSEEVAWGTDPDEADTDGDGQNDGDEVLAGENPTNAASVFRICDAAWFSNRFEIGWFGRSNRVYDVQTQADALGGDFATTVSNLPAVADGMMATNLPVAGSSLFLRLRVRYDDGW